MSGSITPYAGASDARLTAVMNSDNANQVVGGQPYAALRLGVDFTFGPPLAYEDSDGRNTEVAVNVTRAEFQGTDYIQYVRRPLTILNSLPDGYIDLVVLASVPFKLSDVLDKINAALGLDLAVTEIRDQQYTSVQPTYALPIDASVSLGWIDSDFTFKAALPLNLVIANTALNGLYFVNPTRAPVIPPETINPPFIGDFTKDPTQLLLDMVNFSNGTTHATLTPADVVLSAPTPNLNPSAPGNTQLLIASSGTTGYNGQQVITYNRTAINVVPTVLGLDNGLVAGGATKISDLIPLINSKYGIHLVANDYVDGPLPAFAQGVVTQLIQIPMTAASLLWTGTFAIQLSVS